MKNLLLIFLLICGSLKGQSVYESAFEADDWREEGNFFVIAQNWSGASDYDFLGPSAYSYDLKPLHLEFRIQGEGQWQEWQDISHHHDAEAVLDRQTYVAKPFSQKISAWEIRADRRPISALHVRIYQAGIDQEGPQGATGVAESAALCSCPQPNYCDRSCWCPNNDCPPPSSYSPTNPGHLIVHHSAGSNSSSNYAAVVAYIWDLHKNTNGWSDIGYNWLIDPNGVVYEGRGSGVSGAHFSCLNSGTLGICILGDYRNFPVSQASLQALSDLLLYEACINGIKPTGSSVHSTSQLLLRHISGHRDANNAQVGCPSGTVCPGNVLYQKLDSLALAIEQNACLLTSEEIAISNDFFYPNPAMETLHWDKELEDIQIFNASGAAFRLERKDEHAIDLTAMAAGIYFIYFRWEDQWHHQKIAIQ